MLYRFCSQPSGSDGADPSAGLIADKEGALYGTTAGRREWLRSTVFKLDAARQGRDHLDRDRALSISRAAATVPTPTLA